MAGILGEKSGNFISLKSGNPVYVNVFWYLQAWLCEIKDYGKDNVLVVLIGNKCDLEAKREVSTRDGELLAKVFILFFRSSVAVSLLVKIFGLFCHWHIFCNCIFYSY